MKKANPQRRSKEYFKAYDRAAKYPLTTPSQPSIQIKEDKLTVPQVTPKTVQSIENVYEFFTDNRPLGFNYYTRGGSRVLVSTTAFANEKAVVDVDTFTEGTVLIINYLKAYVAYRPNGAVGVGQRANYYEVLSDVGMINLDFEWGLISDDASLYDSNFIEQPALLAANTGSNFMLLNQNVLYNNQAGTSLYIFETGKLSFFYRMNDTVVNLAAALPPNALPAASTTYDEYRPKIRFDIRGHLLNRSDGDLLRELLTRN